ARLLPSERPGELCQMVIVIRHGLAVGGRETGEAVAMGVCQAGAPAPGAARTGGIDCGAHGPLAASFDERIGPGCATTPGDDLDDATDGVRSEQGALRTAHDLDALDV